MWVHWISDHLTSTFKKSIIPKLFRAGHRFFRWCLTILKSNFSKNFSSLGEFLKDLWAKEVTVWFFFFAIVTVTGSAVTRTLFELLFSYIYRIFRYGVRGSLLTYNCCHYDTLYLPTRVELLQTERYLLTNHHHYIATSFSQLITLSLVYRLIWVHNT